MKILVIQTAFIGDVILASSLLEELHRIFPNAQLSILVRKGNEGLFSGHPYLHEVLYWDKKNKKYLNLFKLSCKIRKEKFDLLINLHRFAASGFLTWRSNAKEKIGFDKNPFSFCFHRKIKHHIGNGMHEVERNLLLIQHLGAKSFALPKLYPTDQDFEKIKKYTDTIYICIAPASVWFTKQLPEKKWMELIHQLPENYTIYIVGAKNDYALCEKIKNQSGKSNVINLAGQLNLLESAALMKNALMNYVNDSAPLHLASATNAPTTAFFCSTVPEFGFGPLADQSIIIQTKNELDCRPCGLHGFKSCPKGNFKCGLEIEV